MLKKFVELWSFLGLERLNKMRHFVVVVVVIPETNETPTRRWGGM